MAILQHLRGTAERRMTAAARVLDHARSIYREKGTRELLTSVGEIVPSSATNRVWIAVFAANPNNGPGWAVEERSVETFAIKREAEVCSIPARFVLIPAESKPMSAIRQNAATPKASVTSTKLNAGALEVGRPMRFMAGTAAQLP